MLAVAADRPLAYLKCVEYTRDEGILGISAILGRMVSCGRVCPACRVYHVPVFWCSRAPGMTVSGVRGPRESLGPSNSDVCGSNKSKTIPTCDELSLKWFAWQPSPVPCGLFKRVPTGLVGVIFLLYDPHQPSIEPPIVAARPRLHPRRREATRQEQLPRSTAHLCDVWQGLSDCVKGLNMLKLVSSSSSCGVQMVYSSVAYVAPKQSLT